MAQIPKSKLVVPPKDHYFETYIFFLIFLFLVAGVSYYHIEDSQYTYHEYSFPSDKVEIVKPLLEAESKMKCTTYVQYNLMPTKMVILTQKTICK